jgi:hypothetical protein
VERLHASGEDATLAQQHATYYLALAEETQRQIEDAVVHYEGGAGRLRREQENLRAALQWALDHGAPDVGLRLAAALRWFWGVHAPQDGQRWLAALLALPGPVALGIRARALVVAASLTVDSSDCDYAAVQRWAAESLALARPLGDTGCSAWALLALGRAAVALRSGQARTLMAESLALFAEVGDALGLSQVAWMYRALPDLGLAEGGAAPVQAALEQSLARLRRQGKPRACAMLATVLGGLARDLGDYAHATTWLDEALRLDRQLGDREQLNQDQHERGELALVAGDDARAEALEAASLEGFRARGNKERMQAALINLGYVAQHQGVRERAAALHREALALAVELGDRFHSLDCLAGLAGVAEPVRAARLLGAAAALRDADQSQPVWARRREIERNLAAARAQLDDATFAAAWAEGRAMTLEQAIAYGLEPDTTTG